MTRKIKFLLLFVISITNTWAQMVPMLGNAHIIEYRKKMAAHPVNPATRTQSTSSGYILPFYDEFSNAGPYPDSTKWQNSQSVYINRTKAIAPPTLGVATFDGLNQYGYPYNDNQTIACGNYGNSLGSYASDTLTSVNIRLDSTASGYLSPVDSVYLSFYYQAQGYFEAPESNDELILEFKSIVDDTTVFWNTVWTHSGYTLTDSAWNLVMIPITDTSYFKKDFNFRFRNLSSASGDVDHWHIDVVYLSHNRNYKDTIFGDFAFSYNLPSPLKNYTQMPYNQYAGPSDMKPHTSVALRNNYNDNGHENVGTDYSFLDKNGASLFQHYNGNINLDYYGTVGFCNNDSIVAPSLGLYSYPTMNAPDTFLMKFYLTAADVIHTNDTISFNQYFSNYYAYDDGSAEAGFGICNDTVVVKYKINNADTLRAMDIFFDPIYDVKYLETTSFRMGVWADNGSGMPNINTMYYDTLDRYPYFPVDSMVPGTPQRVNNFLRYQFQKPVYLAAGATFYIGIIPNSYNPLAIGFDRNTNFYQNMFRFTYHNWYVFPAAAIPDYKGSLMIRPVFGDSSSTVSIKDYQAKTNDLKIYPNPANNNIQVSINNAQIAEIKIYNMLGSEVQSIRLNVENNTTQVDISSLQSGMYLVKVLSDKGYMSSQKLMISK